MTPSSASDEWRSPNAGNEWDQSTQAYPAQTPAYSNQGQWQTAADPWAGHQQPGHQQHGGAGVPPGGSAPAPPTKSRMPFIVGGAVILALVIGGLTGYFILQNQNPIPDLPRGTTTPAQTTPAPQTADPGPVEGGGQASPDAAGEVFLHALGNGDAVAVCRTMGIHGLAFEDNDTALESCTPGMQEAVVAVQTFADDLKRAQVSGATIDGTSASFDNARITPSLAKAMLQEFNAVQVQGKWYVTVS